MSEPQPSAEPAGAPTTVTEHTITLRDGVELFYRAWRPPSPVDRAVILFHRGHEHSGRFDDVISALGLEDVAIFAWDERGHGRSPGERGHAESFATLVKDADEFVRFISSTEGIPIANMVVVAHSVGAVLAATWVHDYAPPIRGLVLAAPALRVKLYVPFAIPFCRLMLKIRGKDKAVLKSYVKAKVLTHDPEQARRYEEDPLITGNIAVNILLDLYDTSTRLMEDAGAITTPTLLLAAGSDWVVKLRPQQRLFDDLSSPVKRMRVLPGLYHDLLHELEREPVIDEIRGFVVDSFERSEPLPSLLEADQSGYTKQEYDRLCRPLTPLSPRWIWFGTQRLAMKTMGRLSQGVRVGWETGFDSGLSLDYVYENTPRGTTPLGKAIDKGYLDSIGWRGIRIRKQHLEAMIHAAAERVAAAGQPAQVLDVAAGPGRYVLDALNGISDTSWSALLRDWDLRNVESGEKLAARMGLSNVRYERGDAFDEESLASVSPRPNIAIVSGLYELFPPNDMLLRSLRGLAAAVDPGGWLIYTDQPWHPQVEMIARVLINRDGEPWIMRRRTQAEMDQLVETVGFEKVDMLIDEWGIFTVSLARRA